MAALITEVSYADSLELVEHARKLFIEYSQSIGTDLEYQGFAAELAALPKPYVPPNGALILAQADGDMVGCVALRPLDAWTAEMKRLYVRPHYRSRGVGKQLVETVIETARGAGYGELRLDTLPTMLSAQTLYRHLGFEEISPYGTQYLPGTRFYALKLSAHEY